jgi:feruloyl esterase
MVCLNGVVLACAALASLAQESTAAPARSLGEACAAFAPEQIRNGAEVQAIELAAAANGRPELCVLHGRIASAPPATIHFRLDLPPSTGWNSKILMIGGGGFDGIVPTDHGWFGAYFPDRERMNAYAVVSSDSGHRGRGVSPISDFSWAADNPTAVRNHANEANHLVLWTAVDLARQFYGKEPMRRYMIGASNGGRSGLVATQRYPADYHGVVSLEPAISQEGFTANLVPQMLQHIFS